MDEFIKNFYNNKTKKSLPGVQVVFHHSSTNNKREAPPYICKRGSITVEASIILPLFICFFAAILFYFRVMQVQLIIQGALEETVRNLVIISVEEPEDNRADIWELGVAKGILFLKLKEEKLVEQYVKDGAMGVSLIASDFNKEFMVLNANYKMNFPIKLLGDFEFFICHKTQMRRWNGWHSVDGSDIAEQSVYITTHGEVYHMRRSCPYLELSIQEIASCELEKMRNVKGEKYTECSRCKMLLGDIIYVTDYGDKYHYTIACSGLKRTIYEKRKSEVGGMGACMKCSK